MRRLEYTEGMWWYRESDVTFHRCLILGDWDGEDNYTQVTDEWKSEHEATENSNGHQNNLEELAVSSAALLSYANEKTGNDYPDLGEAIRDLTK